MLNVTAAGSEQNLNESEIQKQIKTRGSEDPYKRDYLLLPLI